MYISARAEFLCTADQYPHLTAANLCEQFLFLDLRFRVMDKSHLIFRDAAFYEFPFYVIVHIESTVFFRGREVRENKLGELFFLTFFPKLHDVFHTQVEL